MYYLLYCRAEFESALLGNKLGIGPSGVRRYPGSSRCCVHYGAVVRLHVDVNNS